MDSKFDSKLISLVEENLEYYLNIYAALPGGSINRDPDLTWIITEVPNKFVNILYGARFHNKGLSERIEMALQPYREKKNPVHWWIGPRTCPPNLSAILVESGFTLSLELTGMFAYRHKILSNISSSGLTIKEVKNFKGLLDFANVFIIANGHDKEASSLIAELWASTGVGPGNEWRYFIGEFEQKPVATVAIRINPESATIVHVAVLPEFRKRGFAKFMTKAALKLESLDDHHLVILHATAMARSLYKKIGFNPICKLSAYTWPGESGY